MSVFKLSAAAALVAASLSASAMTSIADEDLSAVSGQDGVSIAANLNINIGSFTWDTAHGTTATTGGSVSFNNITVTGLMEMTIDVLNAATFQADAGAAVLAAGGGANTAAIVGGVAAALQYTGGDVVQFAFPAAANAAQVHAVTPTITVGSITTGNGGASFGSFTIKNMDLQGTSVWMFGH